MMPAYAWSRHVAAAGRGRPLAPDRRAARNAIEAASGGTAIAAGSTNLDEGPVIERETGEE
jgi:hypothetical protein